MNRRNRWIVTAIAAAAVLGRGSQLLLRRPQVSAQSAHKPPVADAAPIGIRAEAAAIRRVVGSLRVSGQVIPDESRTVKVSPRVAGRLVDVKVKVGDAVQPGEIVASVASTDLAQARA